MLLWSYTTWLNKLNNPYPSWAVYGPSWIKKGRETREWYQLVDSCRRQFDASQSVIHFAAVLKSRVYSFKESEISFFKKERKYNLKNTVGSKIYIATTLRKKIILLWKWPPLIILSDLSVCLFTKLWKKTLKLSLNLVQFISRVFAFPG